MAPYADLGFSPRRKATRIQGARIDDRHLTAQIRHRIRREQHEHCYKGIQHASSAAKRMIPLLHRDV